jgi:hypothetical protein
MTTIWFVFRLKESDVLNCTIATLSRDAARQRLLDLAENDIDSSDTWYRMTRYESPDPLLRNANNVHIAIRWTQSLLEKVEIEGVADQYVMLPVHVQEHEDDYWIDDIELT